MEEMNLIGYYLQKISYYNMLHFHLFTLVTDFFRANSDHLNYNYTFECLFKDKSH